MDNRSRASLMLRASLIAGAIVLVAAPAASAYFGMLTSQNLGIVGTGNWIQTGPTVLEWTITYDTGMGAWHYAYDLSHPVGETSHFILEVSDTFTDNDMFGASGDYTLAFVETQTVQSGNPNMPEDIYGIRFDQASGLNSHFEFYSYRAPVWGDFYSKNGNAGGYGLNSVWNAGFTSPDWDPTVDAMDGAYEGHLLVPDTQTTPPPVPEPATMLLFGSGLAGMVAAIRRRRHA